VTARTLTNREERDHRGGRRRPVPHLIRTLDYEQPREPGSRHCLDGLDEVVIGRTARHEVTRRDRTLVLGVADDLRSDSRVVQGWLGVSGTDAPGGGAVVEAVVADGPAAGHLHAGDVIAAVDTVPVQTMAELRARLYVLDPGTTVALSVHNGGAIRVVDVTLSSSS